VRHTRSRWLAAVALASGGFLASQGVGYAAPTLQGGDLLTRAVGLAEASRGQGPITLGPTTSKDSPTLTGQRGAIGTDNGGSFLVLTGVSQSGRGYLATFAADDMSTTVEHWILAAGGPTAAVQDHSARTRPGSTKVAAAASSAATSGPGFPQCYTSSDDPYIDHYTGDGAYIIAQGATWCPTVVADFISTKTIIEMDYGGGSFDTVCCNDYEYDYATQWVQASAYYDCHFAGWTTAYFGYTHGYVEWNGQNDAADDFGNTVTLTC